MANRAAVNFAWQLKIMVCWLVEFLYGLHKIIDIFALQIFTVDRITVLTLISMGGGRHVFFHIQIIGIWTFA